MGTVHTRPDRERQWLCQGGTARSLQRPQHQVLQKPFLAGMPGMKLKWSLQMDCKFQHGKASTHQWS